MNISRQNLLLLMIGASLALGGFGTLVGISRWEPGAQANASCDVPQECSPLARPSRLDPERARRFADVFRS